MSTNTRKFGGGLDTTSYISPDDKDARWERQQEKLRLAAYLRGDKYFRRGFTDESRQYPRWFAVEKES